VKSKKRLKIANMEMNIHLKKNKQRHTSSNLLAILAHSKSPIRAYLLPPVSEKCCPKTRAALNSWTIKSNPPQPLNHKPNQSQTAQQTVVNLNRIKYQLKSVGSSQKNWSPALPLTSTTRPQHKTINPTTLQRRNWRRIEVVVSPSRRMDFKCQIDEVNHLQK